MYAEDVDVAMSFVLINAILFYIFVDGICLGMCVLRFSIIVTAALFAACSTSSHVLVGTSRPPISPDSVRVYLEPPPQYEQVASLDASSQGSFAITSQQNMDKAIDRMKQEAAKLGANGILVQGAYDFTSGSIGTGVGTSSYSGNSASGASVGGSFGLHSKAVHGLAIYVPPPQ
jgi:cell division protein FtsW (lipid II flippase)